MRINGLMKYGFYLKVIVKKALNNVKMVYVFLKTGSNTCMQIKIILLFCNADQTDTMRSLCPKQFNRLSINFK